MWNWNGPPATRTDPLADLPSEQREQLVVLRETRRRWTAAGVSSEREYRRLVFLRWLYQQRRVIGGPWDGGFPGESYPLPRWR